MKSSPAQFVHLVVELLVGIIADAGVVTVLIISLPRDLLATGIFDGGVIFVSTFLLAIQSEVLGSLSVCLMAT